MCNLLCICKVINLLAGESHKLGRMAENSAGSFGTQGYSDVVSLLWKSDALSRDMRPDSECGAEPIRTFRKPCWNG